MPILCWGKISFAEFGGRCLADFKQAWREVEGWNDDAAPRFYVYADAHEALHCHEVPTAAFSSRAMKDRLVDSIKLVIEGGGSMVAICQTIMAVKAEDGDEPGLILPSRITGLMEQYKADNLTDLQRFRPDLVDEAAAVACFDRDNAKGWQADVKRKRGRPPQLGAWQELVPGGGLLYGPIQEALRK